MFLRFRTQVNRWNESLNLRASPSHVVKELIVSAGSAKEDAIDVASKNVLHNVGSQDVTLILIDSMIDVGLERDDSFGDQRGD
jgi:hypothetical protein